jgi:RNA polymerase II-associated factor 1
VAYTDKWDVINLSHAPLSNEEAEEREEALAEVMDPMFLFSRAEGDGDRDADAEGEVHVEEAAAPAETNGLDDPPLGEVTVEITT